jgi:hypothetical protein
MKARDIIISLALLSLFLVLTDCLQHFGKVLEARDTLRIVTPGHKDFEDVQDFLRGQCWSVGKEVVVMVAQGLVILLVMKRQPNNPLHAPAAAPGS